jgi:hypothetical protein
MNSNTIHENEIISFSIFSKKRKLENKDIPENIFEEKISYEWKFLPFEEKMKYYKLAEENGLTTRRPDINDTINNIN